ncbi:hypothetical protein SHELI_v1c04980 [Spiroplasma helicoides]|uniref:MATE efflux family protein n=1 Tax=Spiroplasma helicoides TaxID=216938 RepID=A0A1B3SKI7_9MOLU|nr:hypothetical protein [Spiroplasma helicoides]AOG60449.1 hypothetical protein SHELI_v1c04980 [Spiroplasma helicoides]
MKNIKLDFKSIDWKLFLSFLVFSLVPAIWTLVRTFVITNVAKADINTMAQWEFVNSALEMLQEGFVLPLFWWFGVSLKSNKKSEFQDRVKWSYFINFIIYTSIIIILSFFVSDFVQLTTGSNEGSLQKTYFLLELWAKIPNILFLISITVLSSLNKWKWVLIIALVKLLLGITFDFTLVNASVVGQENGYVGIGLSTLITGLFLFLASFLLILKEIGYKKFFIFKKIQFSKEIILNVTYSFLESFVRNIFYLMMVAKMVNTIQSAGTYWLANSIIWNWILLPLSMMGYIQKAAVSQNIEDKKEQLKILFNYLAINLSLFLGVTFVFIGLWKPLASVINNNEYQVNVSYYIFINIIWFYIAYVVSDTINSSLYGQGKIQYILIQSIIVNFIVYTPLYIFYKNNTLSFDLYSIVIMFGFTFVVGAIFTIILFIFNMSYYKKPISTNIEIKKVYDKKTSKKA